MNWIKCSERMPEKYLAVLAKDQVGKIHTSYFTGFMLCNDPLFAYIDGRTYPASLRGGFVPTDWMPIPEAPEE
jgi:hypothetical protein